MFVHFYKKIFRFCRFVPPCCRQLQDQLAATPWHAVIVDEAHRIKNPDCLTAKAADRLPTRLRYALTGTPQVPTCASRRRLVPLCTRPSP